MKTQSALCLSFLRDLLTEITADPDPSVTLQGAEAITLLLDIAERRAFSAYDSDPMSDYAPGECGDAVLAPFERFREELEETLACAEAAVTDGTEY